MRIQGRIGNFPGELFLHIVVLQRMWLEKEAKKTIKTVQTEIIYSTFGRFRSDKPILSISGCVFFFFLFFYKYWSILISITKTNVKRCIGVSIIGKIGMSEKKHTHRTVKNPDGRCTFLGSFGVETKIIEFISSRDVRAKSAAPTPSPGSAPVRHKQ